MIKIYNGNTKYGNQRTVFLALKLDEYDIHICLSFFSQNMRIFISLFREIAASKKSTLFSHCCV
jgi:hypothetical protein